MTSVMCAKSRKSFAKSRVGAKAKLGCRFAAAVPAQAQQTAARYRIVMRYEDGEWYGRGREMPQVFGDGATPELCIKNTRAALTAAVAYLIESGQRVS